ncbi:hypothetical protein ACFQY7_15710 [Actinomadura luteofluorescens]
MAGNETTRNALSHALTLLTDNPGQRDVLLADLDVRLPPPWRRSSATPPR